MPRCWSYSRPTFRRSCAKAEDPPQSGKVFSGVHRLMANQLLATKSISDLQADDSSGPQLKRVLSATALTALGIGGIIGTGIFVLTGVAAANHAGPALALAFIVAGFGCTLAGLCYAEFAAMIPVSGSAYSYSYATLG